MINALMAIHGKHPGHTCLERPPPTLCALCSSTLLLIEVLTSTRHKHSKMKTVDYLLSALKHHGGRADGFLTDTPIGIKLAEDDIVRVRYDAQTMSSPTPKAYGVGLRTIRRFVVGVLRPSRIKYPTARELIKQYRKEYAERLS